MTPTPNPADELRETLTEALFRFDYGPSIDWNKLSEQVKWPYRSRADHLLTALTPILERREAGLRAERDEAQEALTPLVQLVEARTLECDESFETEDVLASHYKRLEAAETLCVRQRDELTAAQADKRRLDWLEELIRNCPHAEFYFSDDDANEKPLGFSIEVDGCDPTLDVGETLRAVIDTALARKEGAT